jgi:hypothetical protein
MDANPPSQAKDSPFWSVCPHNLVAILKKFLNGIRRFRIEEAEVIERRARVEVLPVLVRVFGLHAQFEICLLFAGITFLPCGYTFSLLRFHLPLLPSFHFLLPPYITFFKRLFRSDQLTTGVPCHMLAKSTVEREEQAGL